MVERLGTVNRGRRLEGIRGIVSPMTDSVPPLPPTSPELDRPGTRPYFLWWTAATVADLRRHLRADDPEERAYWLGALLREANTRDVWAFVRPAGIRADWPRLVRHLGRSREMWAWLLGLDPAPWPPPGAYRG